MTSNDCETCKGGKLKQTSLAVKIETSHGSKNIHELSLLSIDIASKMFDELKLNERQEIIARQILKEIKMRLDFMLNVGLNYITFDRSASTLSGGEAQRIKLATQIGSQLRGVLYILDEPSIGFHQRDNNYLLSHLRIFVT